MSILRSAAVQYGGPPNKPGVAAHPSLSTIRAVVRGAESSALSRATALELLTSSQYPTKHRDLQFLLEDENESPKLRYLAALGLARTDVRAAHQILVEATRINNDRVRAGVMRALGQIGGREAYDAIGHVLPETGDLSRTHAVFARTLIAHRLGLPEQDAPLPPASDILDMAPEHGIRVHIRRALSAEVERSLVSLGQRPYGIELADEPMYEYRCNRCAGTIMLNREFADRAALNVLRQRKAIFGIGTLRDEATGTYSAAALFLTAPDVASNGIRVSVHLTNGNQLFVGNATVRGDEASWQLHAVRRLGAFPIHAEGRFKNGHLNITLAASGTRVVQRAQPVPIDLATDHRPVVQQSRA